MVTTSTSNGKAATNKKKQKQKDLDGLAQLTEANFCKVMKFQLETDAHESGETMVAYEEVSVVGNDNNNPTNIQLHNLTADQLCRLCKNVGVKYAHNGNKKFACRKALWTHAANHQLTRREMAGVPISTAVQRASSNVVRLVNVIFSHNFYEAFLKLNDIMKGIKEHKTGGLPSDFFWGGGDVTEVLNGDSDDNPSPLQTVVSPGSPHHDELVELDLHKFDNMTVSVVRKKFNLVLLKVRKVMLQESMHTSGKHLSVTLKLSLLRHREIPNPLVMVQMPNDKARMAQSLLLRQGWELDGNCFVLDCSHAVEILQKKHMLA